MCESCRSGEDPVHWPQANGVRRDPPNSAEPPNPGQPNPLTTFIGRVLAGLILLVVVACALGCAVRALQWAWPG